ncbi:TetR/AcrR family transcriptional regulator [Limnobacter sp.]|uniref:TetR/AcrR family transcriptional regulator n=1 Tax=Limnobacter sp. TaxID=2003368 RepID=UPI0035195ACF
MGKIETLEKRPYLGKEERKNQLVQAAAALVEAQGWAELNMSTLAQASGVSRQLVYQHFPSLESLLTATAWAIFVDTMQGTQQAIAANAHDIKAAIRAAAVVSMDMPQGRGDALWQMIAGMNQNMPELETIRTGIRDLVLRIWLPLLKKHRSMSDKAAASLVWMLIMAFWGARNLVRDGVVSRKQALAQFDVLLESVFG